MINVSLLAKSLTPAEFEAAINAKPSPTAEETSVTNTNAVPEPPVTPAVPAPITLPQLTAPEVSQLMRPVAGIMEDIRPILSSLLSGSSQSRARVR